MKRTKWDENFGSVMRIVASKWAKEERQGFSARERSSRILGWIRCYEI